MALVLRPGNAYYLTNAAGQPKTWVVYAGPAMNPAQVRVRVKDEGNVVTVDRNRLQEIPGYVQVDPIVYLEQGGLPNPPPAPAAGWAQENMAGGRSRRTRRNKKLRLKRSRKSKAVRK